MKSTRTLIFTSVFCLPTLLPAATTYWSNYQPSTNPQVQTGEGWPRSTTSLTPESLATLGPGDKYSGWYFSGPLVRQGFTTEFTVPNEFTATHMTIPVRSAGSYPDTLIDIHIDRFDNDNGIFVQETRSFVRPAQLPTTAGMYIDYTIKFGSNNSSVATLFDATPLTFSPGNVYRFRVGGYNGGGVGGFRLRDSLVDGASTNTTATASNAASLADVAFQPAFAFNDGANSVVPEPSASLLALIGSLFIYRRRRP